MISDLPNLSDHSEIFQTYLQSEEIYTTLITQLNRDFNRASFDFMLPNDRHYSFLELSKMISERLKFSEKGNFSLSQLYYIIDINESTIRALENDSESSFDIIAQTILKRDLQKVIFKRIYK